MRRLAARFAFVHRTLWQRDAAYRWAVLLGPPPLIGGALAALVLIAWQSYPQSGAAPEAAVPWAHWTRPIPRGDQPYAEAATRKLPQKDAAGRFLGFQAGWVGEILPISLDSTMEVNVIASPITSLTFDGPTMSLARIVDAGPPSGLFVGAAKTFFVVRTAGLYAFSAQLTWSGTQSANCIVRFLSAHHGMIRSENLNVTSGLVLNYAATDFRLESGLFLLQAAVGCWRGDHPVAPGTLTVLVRRPGEVALTPATADELIRPLPPGTAGPR